MEQSEADLIEEVYRAYWGDRLPQEFIEMNVRRIHQLFDGTRAVRKLDNSVLGESNVVPVSDL